MTRWRFFTEAEAETVDAVCERIFPSGDGKPGARETQRHHLHRQDDGERGRSLAPLLPGRSGGTERPHFRTLRPAVRGTVRRTPRTRCWNAIEASRALTSTGGAEGPEDEGLLATFFALVWEHTIQGMFCDPKYGGNHDALGWQLVGFPGAQWGYNAEQMRPGFDSKAIPIKTLEDLRRELRRADA